jgi:ABC-type transporter Mla MlaB component
MPRAQTESTRGERFNLHLPESGNVRVNVCRYARARASNRVLPAHRHSRVNVMSNERAIVLQSPCFAHHDAVRLFTDVMDHLAAKLVVIDLSVADDATTSAFARLVLLRRELLRLGSDLRLRGLRDRAARLYEVSRLDSVLPRA